MIPRELGAWLDSFDVRLCPFGDIVSWILISAWASSTENSSYYYYAIVDKTYQVNALNIDTEDDYSLLIENTFSSRYMNHLCKHYLSIQYHTVHFHY